MPPREWIIVENGSSDRTPEVAAALAADHAWIRVVHHEEPQEAVRGGAIVRAFGAGVAALTAEPDVIVNLDADVSFDSDFFERLLAHFEAEPTLGIASGTGFEPEHGEWRERFVTRTTVWGAIRAYRWACFEGDLAARGAPRLGRPRRADRGRPRLGRQDAPRPPVPSPPA